MTERDRDVDVVVIGMGPGGEHAAGTLAEAGLVVAGVEDRLVGGECPYWGCVPSKMMIRAANLIMEGNRVNGMAGTARVDPDWTPVARRIRDEATDDWDDKVAVDRFTGKGGIFVRGHGRISAPGEVTVTSSRPDGGGQVVLRARRGIVINTGTAPAVPPIPGLAGTPFWTNREAIEAERVPGSLVILGGGSVGVELGQVFARFGSRVTVVERKERLLPKEEPEAGDLLARVFGREGIGVHTGQHATGVRHNRSGFTVALGGGGELTGEALLVTPIPQSARGWIHKAGNDGFIKLVEDVGAGVLAGATSAGPAGGEVLGALVMAVHARVPVRSMRQMIYAYPTFHRAIEDALAGLG